MPVPAELFEQASRLHKQKRLAKAEKIYRRVLTALPDEPRTLHRLGVLSYERQNYQQAEKLIRAAIEQKPTTAAFYNNLGNVLKDQGKLADAAISYGKALQFKPRYAGACENLNTLALALYAQGYYAPATKWLLKITQNLPEYAEAHANLGAMFIAQHRFAEAAAPLREAIRLEPKHAVAVFNLGLAELGLRHYDKAKRLLERALELRPDDAATFAYICQLRSQMCDWQDYEQTVSKLTKICEKHLESDTTVMLPLHTLQRFPLPLALTAAVTRKQAGLVEQRTQILRIELSLDHTDPEAKLDPCPERLRLGYVSADFRKHPVGWLVKELFSQHDRRVCEVHGYGLVPVDDVVTEQIRNGCDTFTNISASSADQAARRIYQDRIQILIDLTGYTTFCRPEIFALRPAPVQAHYLGYLSTMGAEFIDYIIADDVVIPPPDEKHYQEKIVKLPDGFCVASPMPISPEPVTRQQASLPEQAFVFCSLNNPYKIDPQTFGLWMRILERVPDSVLWLAEPEHPVAIENLKASAKRRNVDPKRVLFAPTIPLPRHLTRSTLADLFLDTLVYNAGATAVGLLQAGLPLITIPGNTFLSCMGASLLRAAGMPELICQDRQQFVELAVRLATHPAELAAVRNKLADNRHTAALFDTNRWVKHLEAAYQQMWRNYLAGAPQHICVPASTKR